MCNMKNKLILCLFALTIVGATASARDLSATDGEFSRRTVDFLPFEYRFLVDRASAAYRTGEIDPAVAEIPASVQAAALRYPETGIPRLCAFLRYDGGAAGPVRDDYHYVKRIHDWITNNVAYDSNLLHNTPGHIGSREPVEFLPYLGGPRTTCGGFARLFRWLAEEGGIDVKHIPGLTRSYRTAGGRIGNHAWNAVRINRRWYIVDSTADNRMGHRDGVRSAPGAYNDYWLFVSPETMLVKDIADDPADQLVPHPISYEEFLRMPRFSTSFLSYGIDVPSGSFFDDRRTREFARWSGNLYSTADVYDSRDGLLEIDLLCPKDSYLYGYLYDQEEAHSLRYSCTTTYEAYDHETYLVHLTFSVPGPGYHKANIRVRPIGERSLSRSIYSFYVSENRTAGPLLPVENRMEQQMLCERYPITISPVSYPTPEYPYYTYTVTYEEGVSVYSSLKGIGIEDPENHLFATYDTPYSKTYSFSRPPPGDYRLEVHAKYDSKDTYSDRIAMMRISSQLEGPRRRPDLQLHLTGNFHDKGFELVSHNLDAPVHDRVYQVAVRAPREYGMYCLLIEASPDGTYRSDADGSTIKPRQHYTRSYADSVYTFSFSPGDPMFHDSCYRARMYLREESGRSYMIAEFFLNPGNRAGTPVPITGTIQNWRAYSEEEIRLREENLATAARDGYLRLSYTHPPGTTMSAAIRDSAGASRDPASGRYYVSDYRVYDYRPDRFDIYLRPPSDERYQVYIYAQGADDENRRAVQELLIDGNGFTDGPVLPSDRLILTERFVAQRLELLHHTSDSAYHDRVHQVHIRAPKETDMYCFLVESDQTGAYRTDEAGDTLYQEQHAATSFNGETFTFSFSPGTPAYDDSRFRGRIYANRDGTNMLVAELYLDPGSGPGSPVPSAGTVARRLAFFQRDCEIIGHNLATSRRDGHVYLHIAHPPETEISSVMRDPDGNSRDPETNRYYTSDYRRYSYHADSLELFFSPPSDETYRVLIYAKALATESRSFIGEFLINGGEFTERAFPPANRLFLDDDFVSEGYRLISSNIETARDGSVYELVIDAPPGTEMRSRMRDMVDANQSGHYRAEHSGNRWTLRFSCPAAGRYQGRIYRWVDGSYSLRGYFFVEDSWGGPTVTD